MNTPFHTISAAMVFALAGGVFAGESPGIVTGSVAGNLSGAGHSLAPAMTPDGRWVAFVSHANNLVTNDDLRPYADVFVRDRVLSRTTLVSVDTSGTGGGNADSSHVAISTNGQFVVFASYASNLVPDDTNGISDVFQRDLQSGVTRLLSVGPGGGAGSASPLVFAPVAGSSKPVMTPDGRWVAFESTAELDPGSTNGIADIFVCDTREGGPRLVTVGAQSWGSGRGRSHSASIADDGRRIVFVSTAANVVPGRTNRNGDIYVYDLQTATTFWVSSNLVAHFNNGPEGYACVNPVISADGQYVAFKAWRLDGPVEVFHHNVESGVTRSMASNSIPSTAPALSLDGLWVGFEQTNNTFALQPTCSIYLRDSINNTNLLVSVNAAGTGPANGMSFGPVITRDARHVAFASSASNVVAMAIPGLTRNLHLYIRDVAAGVTRPVSVGTNGPSGFDMEGALAALSSDGQLVAFDTDASDLVMNDNNQAYDVFVRDIQSQATQLVSAPHETRPPRTGIQAAGTSANSISADGRFIAFSSLDDPRTEFDTNRLHDVFVGDLLAGGCFRASAAATNLVFSALDPIISGNGRAVFYSLANYYVYGSTYALAWRSLDRSSPETIQNAVRRAGDTNFAALSFDGRLVVYRSVYDLELYWKNMLTGSNGLVSAALNGFLGGGESRNPVVSPDSRFVAFVSTSQRLVSTPVTGTNMFIRDLQSNVTTLASIDGDGMPLANAGTIAGVFSANGRYLAFYGNYTEENSPQIYRYDLQTRQSRLVCDGCRNPSISADGQVIAFNTGFPRSIGIYVTDLASDTTRLVTRDYLGNSLDQRVGVPLLSADGRFIVFESRASNLVLDDTNGFSDVFVHDRVQQTTMLVSRSRFGARSARGISSKPVMSADGRTVIFQSFADDLVEGDYNERRDIFVLKLGVGDSDNDGMDDDWEVAYFDNLDRNGTGDYDNDGHTDLQEFLSGTDPRNSGSVLRVLTISPMGGGSTTVVWSAVPNRHYVVQYKDSLESPGWANASGVLTANAASESFTHASSAVQRFYRVITIR